MARSVPVIHFPSQIVRTAIPSLLFGGALAVYGNSNIPAKPVCLYSAASKAKQCPPSATDVKDLSRDPVIKKFIDAYALNGTNIEFAGCEGGAFSTWDISVSDTPSFSINYPIMSVEKSEYAAAIAHELAHVVQLKSYGGYANLVDGRNRRSIELAADYIAGLIYGRIRSNINELNPDSFQRSLYLVGKYKDDEMDDHGTWIQRTIAFRSGLYSRNPPEIAGADKYFVREIYGKIVK